MMPDWLLWSQYLTMMGVEAAWFYALISVLKARITGGPVSAPLLLLLLPVAFILNKLVQRLRWHPFFLKTLSWLGWAALMLLITKVQLYPGTPWGDSEWLLAVPRSIPLILSEFPAEVLILITTPFLWWLGRRLAYLKLSFFTSVAEFQFGLIMMVFAVLLGSALDANLKYAIPLAMIFFAFALLGMAVAHARENSGWRVSTSAHWPGLVALSTGIVLAGGFLIGVFMAPEFLQAFLAAVKWAWDMLVKLLEYLASLIPPQPSAQLPPGMSLMPAAPPEEPIQFFDLSETWRQIMQILVGIGFGAMFLLALWRIAMSILDLIRRRLAAASEGEYERLDGALKQDFLSLLKALFRLLFRPREWRRRKRLPISPEAASVRQVYQQLLKWAAGRGHARRAWETPYEYLSGTLAAYLPGQGPGLLLITDQYVKARYGDIAPNPAELRNLRDTWNKIRNTGKKTGG